MLVAAGELLHGVDVDAALVRERRRADERRAGIVRAVRQFVDEKRHLRQGGEVRDDFQAHLGLQTGDERGEVAVARAFAVAVDRALHLHRPGAHGGQRVGDAEAAVVVRVDAQRGGGKVGRRGAEDRFDLVGQAAAVGIAEDDQVRAAVAGGGQRGERVVGIVLVTVEEVFGVVDRPRGRGF